MATISKNHWRRRLISGLGACLMVLLMGCSGPANRNTAAFVLIDISSDYATELEKARGLSRYLLSSLSSGDSIAIAFIDYSSFTENNMIAQATFDHRPSVTNQQKRAVQNQLDAFIEEFKVPSFHSDISGGVLLASDYLQELEAGEKHLFILSDLHENLPPQLNRDVAANLKGVEVVAVNVKRQRSDNIDPSEYKARLANWQDRVEKAGGQWELVSDLSRLENSVALQ